MPTPYARAIKATAGFGVYFWLKSIPEFTVVPVLRLHLIVIVVNFAQQQAVS